MTTNYDPYSTGMYGSEAPVFVPTPSGGGGRFSPNQAYDLGLSNLISQYGTSDNLDLNSLYSGLSNLYSGVSDITPTEATGTASTPGATLTGGTDSTGEFDFTKLLTSLLTKVGGGTISDLLQGNTIDAGNAAITSALGVLPSIIGQLTNNPALGQMTGTATNLAGQYLTNTGMFTPATVEAVNALASQGITDVAAGDLASLGLNTGVNLSPFFNVGAGNWSNPYSGVVESIGNIVPMLGTVLGGFLEGVLGNDPEIPYMQYDPTTRSFVSGLVYGDISGGQDQSIIQAQMNQIQGTIQDSLVKQYASQFGVDPNNMWIMTDPGGSGAGDAWMPPTWALKPEAQNLLTAVFGTTTPNPSAYLPYMNPQEAYFYQTRYSPLFEITSASSGGILTPYAEWILQGGQGAVGV